MKHNNKDSLNVLTSKLRHYRPGGGLPLLCKAFFKLETCYSRGNGLDYCTSAIKQVTPTYGLAVYQKKRPTAFSS